MNQYGGLEEYLSYDGDSIVIPVELLQIMASLPDDCYLYVYTSYTDYYIDYYTLETYFMYGGDFENNYVVIELPTIVDKG